MKKFILTFSLLAIFTLANTSTTMALDTKDQNITEANIQLPELDIDPDEIIEEAQNNKVTLIIIASLSVLLILFILFWLGARDRAKKRKLTAKEAVANLSQQTKELNTFKQETLILRGENSELTVLLEKEKTKTENLNDLIQKFEQTTVALNTKVEELQSKVTPTISEAARKEIDNLEVKTVKIKNIAKLKEEKAITEKEADEMKAKLMKDLI